MLASGKRKECGVVRRSVRDGNGYSDQYSVSLYPLDLAIVQAVQERQYLGTVSGAVQFVLRRYADEHGIEVRGRLGEGTETTAAEMAAEAL
ncbi:MAG: hypothetical protein GWO24_30435 [Akkermansiaceae bacterium]|nr:hypothetical protein [Akkermansiaceae bacterium]